MKSENNYSPMHRRSDLALERRRVHPKEEGARYKEAVLGDIRFTALTVTKGEARAAGKTLSIVLPEHLLWSDDEQGQILTALRLALQLFFPTPCARLLVAGLGNRRLTADCLGPLVAERVGVSAALPEALAAYFQAPCATRVAVCIPDVFPRTGIESVRTVEAFASLHRADAVLTVDALAAREEKRLFRVIEITNTGTVPGGGVKQGTLSLTEKALGIPVISLGIPTVVRMGDAHFLVSRSMEDELQVLVPLIAEAIDLCFAGDTLPMESALSSLFDAE